MLGVRRSRDAAQGDERHVSGGTRETDVRYET